MQAEKTLYLVRGIPGAGKSTFAETLAESLHAYHFESDQYFIAKEDCEDGTRVGDYNWNPEKVHRAHLWCEAATNEWMKHGVTLVVSNTFTREKELKPYLDLAEKHGYRVVSLIVENRHGSKSVHDVPDATLEKMRNRFSVKL